MNILVNTVFQKFMFQKFISHLCFVILLILFKSRLPYCGLKSKVYSSKRCPKSKTKVKTNNLLKEIKELNKGCNEISKD